MPHNIRAPKPVLYESRIDPHAGTSPESYIGMFRKL